MTLKGFSERKRKFTPLLHEILWTVRRYWWVAFSGMILFFVFTHIATRLEGNRSDEFSLIMRNSEVALRIAGVFYGLFAAFALFSFVWNRREALLYLSVGTARPKQFLLRYLFGFISVVLGIVIPFLTAYCLEMRNFGEDPYGITSQYVVVYVTAMVTLTLLSYTVGSLVAVLCGNFLSALLSAVGVLAAPYAFLWGAQTMIGFYLFGSPLGKTLLTDHLGAGLFTMLADQLPYRYYTAVSLQPSTTAMGYGQGYLLEIAKNELPTLPTVRMILLFILMSMLAILAGLAYCRRPAEHSGKTAVHAILSHAVAISSGLCIASLVLTSKAPAEGIMGTVILTVLFVLALIISAASLRLILIRDLKAVVRQYPIPCGTGAMCLLVTFFLGTGWFGYSSYVPDSSDVASVTVSYNQNVALFNGKGQEKYFQSNSPDSKKATRTSVGNYNGSCNYAFLYAQGFELNEGALPELIHPEDVEIALSIHDAIVTDGHQTFTGQPADKHERTVVPVSFRITYILKNGKTVERYYEYLTLATLEKTVEAENTLAFREEISKAYTETSPIVSNVFEFGDPLFADFTSVELSDEERRALIAAMDLDNAMMTADDRYFNNTEVIGIIRVRLMEGHSIISNHPHDRKYVTFYVTAAWENTLPLLRQKGLDTYFSTEYTITAVQYQRYEPRFLDDKLVDGVSYVFHSCDNLIQILLPDDANPSDLIKEPIAAIATATDPVPADKWDAYLTASRPVALMTRPGVMVQIILKNEKGDTKLVTRYLYDTDTP